MTDFGAVDRIFEIAGLPDSNVGVLMPGVNLKVNVSGTRYCCRVNLGVS